MTADEIALLRTVQAHPNADLPRLVYADWLDDHGQHARAEFVRLQIDRFHRAATDPDARGISWREYELLQEHELDWKAELPPGFRDGAAFRRGLVHRVRCRVRDLFAATDIPIVAPVETLTVIVDELSAEWLTLTPPAMLLPLRNLLIQCDVPVGRYLAEILTRFGPFPHLRQLGIRDGTFGDDGAAGLHPDTFPVLRHLDLSAAGLGHAGRRTLRAAFGDAVRVTSSPGT